MEQEIRDQIVSQLKQNKVKVVFTKVDGSQSEMIATLKPELLPVREVVETKEVAPKKERKVNPDTLTLFNVDKQSWRSVKYDLIEKFEIVE